MIPAVTADGRAQILAGQDHGPANEVLAPVRTEFFACAGPAAGHGPRVRPR